MPRKVTATFEITTVAESAASPAGVAGRAPMAEIQGR